MSPTEKGRALTLRIRLKQFFPTSKTVMPSCSGREGHSEYQPTSFIIHDHSDEVQD